MRPSWKDLSFSKTLRHMKNAKRSLWFSNKLMHTLWKSLSLNTLFMLNARLSISLSFYFLVMSVVGFRLGFEAFCCWSDSCCSSPAFSAWESCFSKTFSNCCLNHFMENWYMWSSMCKSCTAKKSLAPWLAVCSNFCLKSLIFSSLLRACLSCFSMSWVVSFDSFSYFTKLSVSSISSPELRRVARMFSKTSRFLFCSVRAFFEYF